MRRKINQFIDWVKNHSLLLKLIFLGSVLIFVVYQVTHIAQGMSWQAVFRTMAQQKKLTNVGMVLLGFLGVLPMFLYDYVVIRVLEEAGKPKMKIRDWFVCAWVTNTINNLAGFGGVVGATLRANFYGKDIARKKVVATVSKVALFLVSGLSILSFVTFIDVFFIRPDSLFRKYWIWLLMGSLIAPALFIFTSLKRHTLFKHFYPKKIFLLFVASLGQWCGAMCVFLAIGQLMNVSVSSIAIYPMFIIATLIGMLTMVPGGMGTFDVLMILGLAQLGVDQSTAVVWLLYYRLFYYVVPFLTGVILLVHQTGVKVNRFFDNLPRVISQKMAHTILVSALYFAGIMLVLLSTVTNLSNVSRLFQVLLPFSFDFLDQTFNMLIGFLLLGLARGISMKVRKAYWPTIVLLIFGIINTISRTTSWKLIFVYLIILIAVFLAKEEFYREKFVYSWGALVVDSLLFGCLSIIYAVAGYYSTHPEKTGPIPQTFLLFPSDDVWFSGLVGLGISMVGLITLYQYLADTTGHLGESLEVERLNQLLDRFGGNESSQFLYLKNYNYYYYQENNEDLMLFGYQIKADKCFVAGNPIGNPTKWAQATFSFMNQADLLGYRVVFYRISDEYVMTLHDLGYHFMKVGEEGTVCFKDALPSRLSKESTVTRKLANLGYTFHFYQEPVSNEIFEELKRVSNDWLGTNKDKNFISGRFDRMYLDLAGVGLMRNSKQEIVGFITEKKIQTGKEVAYGLLRYSSEAPAETADFLLIHFIDTFKHLGYPTVDLGVAPLANVGETKYSFFEERLINILYNYGYLIYEFQDKRKAKEQYVTSWSSRYCAYPKQSNALFTFIQLLLLIGRGRRKKVSLVDEVMDNEDE